jgi:2-succinyl-6-hydroxy-2,4-cyclohexadiene-1-carboxylate synthase
MTRIAVNGISLNVETSGRDEGPALLLLHGFTRDARAWEPLLPCIDDYRTVRVDLIGHGKSAAPANPARYSMQHAVEDLTALLHHLDIERTALLGYSLGGRVALHFAVESPQLLWALVVESASPGIEDDMERDARFASDLQLAASIETEGLEAFADRWQSQPLFASQRQLPPAVLDEQRRQRLDNSTTGLGNSLRGMGAGAQRWLFPELPHIDTPTLFLAGALDERYAALAPVMAAAVPGAEHHIIESAGHTVHLEQPEPYTALVTDFLARHRPDSNER